MATFRTASASRAPIKLAESGLAAEITRLERARERAEWKLNYPEAARITREICVLRERLHEALRPNRRVMPM